MCRSFFFSPSIRIQTKFRFFECCLLLLLLFFMFLVCLFFLHRDFFDAFKRPLYCVHIGILRLRFAYFNLILEATLRNVYWLFFLSFYFLGKDNSTASNCAFSACLRSWVWVWLNVFIILGLWAWEHGKNKFLSIWFILVCPECVFWYNSLWWITG